MKKRAERRRETRRRIVEAAVELHRARGPARTTVKEIADYYKHPLYPSAEIMPETLLNRISPVSDGGY